MAIKMRVASNDRSKSCHSCGKDINRSLDLFDVKISFDVRISGEDEKLGFQFTLCDECMQALFYKSLKACNHTSKRVKQPKDIKVLNSRNRHEEYDSDTSEDGRGKESPLNKYK